MTILLEFQRKTSIPCSHKAGLEAAEVGAISEIGRAEDSELDELEKGAFANGELEVDSGTDEPGMGAVTIVEKWKHQLIGRCPHKSCRKHVP